MQKKFIHFQSEDGSSHSLSNTQYSSDEDDPKPKPLFHLKRKPANENAKKMLNSNPSKLSSHDESDDIPKPIVFGKGYGKSRKTSKGWILNKFPTKNEGYGSE